MSMVICRYRVKPEFLEEFVALLRDHWPALRRLGLATGCEPVRLRRDADDGPEVVEVFEWVDADAARRAHEHPEVAAVWEKMGALVEPRGGAAQWEFVHYDRLA